MSIHCTEAEWKIMEVLWETAPRTMPEITRILEPQTGWSPACLPSLKHFIPVRYGARGCNTPLVKRRYAF